MTCESKWSYSAPITDLASEASVCPEGNSGKIVLSVACPASDGGEAGGEAGGEEKEGQAGGKGAKGKGNAKFGGAGAGDAVVLFAPADPVPLVAWRVPSGVQAVHWVGSSRPSARRRLMALNGQCELVELEEGTEGEEGGDGGDGKGGDDSLSAALRGATTEVARQSAWHKMFGADSSSSSSSTADGEGAGAGVEGGAGQRADGTSGAGGLIQGPTHVLPAVSILCRYGWESGESRESGGGRRGEKSCCCCCCCCCCRL